MINSTQHLVEPLLSLVLTTIVEVETVETPLKPVDLLGDYSVCHTILMERVFICRKFETTLVQTGAVHVLLSVAVLVLQLGGAGVRNVFILHIVALK